VTETKRDFLTAVERTYGRRLRQFLSARVRNTADIPDLAQEVFLRLLRLDSHESIRNPQAYLYTIASHVLNQHALRDAATANKVRFADLLSGAQASTQPDPAAEIETQQFGAALAHALEKHSPRAYLTLVLHRTEGMPLKEVASQLGVSYSMAKRYLAQALAFCQLKLEDPE